MLEALRAPDMAERLKATVGDNSPDEPVSGAGTMIRANPDRGFEPLYQALKLSLTLLRLQEQMEWVDYGHATASTMDLIYEVDLYLKGFE